MKSTAPYLSAILSIFSIGTSPLWGEKLDTIIGADPAIIHSRGKYWMYPTDTMIPNRQFVAYQYRVYSSTNLKEWEAYPPILKIEDINWAFDDGAKQRFLWAPGVIEKNEKYFLYFSLGPNHPTPSMIGVAVADQPQGPFIDTGKPLLKGGPFGDGKFEAIDAMVFIDPKTDIPYFYAGGGAGKTMRVFEMKDNMIEFEKEIPVDTPPHFQEGAFIHHDNDRYYLSYSSGSWNQPSYSVHYATSNSPVGPWDYKGSILETAEGVYGPGHHSFIKNPDNGELYIVYHYWTELNEKGNGKGVRLVGIDPITYDKWGNLTRVNLK